MPTEQYNQTGEIGIKDSCYILKSQTMDSTHKPRCSRYGKLLMSTILQHNLQYVLSNDKIYSFQRFGVYKTFFFFFGSLYFSHLFDQKYSNMYNLQYLQCRIMVFFLIYFQM